MDKRTLLFVVLMAGSFYLIQLFFPKAKEPALTKPPTQVVEKKIDQPRYDKKQFIPKDTAQESFYVLENDYQMLVFSTKGGSLAEINLPFRTKENQKSIVREIQFDKDIKDLSPRNATFPLNPYYIYENGKITKKNEGHLSGYYPLIRRPIKNGHQSEDPKYYSMNLVSSSEDLQNAHFKLLTLEKDYIEFEHISSRRRIVKKFSFSKEAPYIFDMTISIEGAGRNLWLSSGVPEVELTSGRSDPRLKIRTFRKQKSVVDKLKLPKNQTTVSTVYPDWICNSNGFLGLIIDPLEEIPPGYRSKYIQGESFPTRLSLIDPQYNLYPAKKYPGYEMFLPLKSSMKNTTFRVFAGPFAKDILKAVDATYSNAISGYNPDYAAAQSFHGIFAFISAPFSKLMFSLMQLFHKLTHSWGFSIILLTLALKVMLYPLNAWSIKSNMRMQEMAPKVKELQKRYAKDPQRLKLEMMKLYKTKGANPLMGCFPILIQFPFLIGMFDLLKSSFELRGVPFVPGWINSLTSPDVLFSWNYPIPVIGTEFHLLPIIMGATMFVQSKIMAKKQCGPGACKPTDKQKQQQTLSTIMPLVLTFIFYSMPSGLNIYFLFSTVFGILQQVVMNKTIAKKNVNVT